MVAIVVAGFAPSSTYFAWACFSVAEIFVFASVPLALPVCDMKFGSWTYDGYQVSLLRQRQRYLHL